MSREPNVVSAHVGGNFNNGANDGCFYWNLNNSSGNTNINIGSRLLMELNNRSLFSLPLGKNKSRTGEASTEREKLIDEHKKMKRYSNIFGKIIDEKNILNAIYKASKRKRKRESVQKILENDSEYASKISEMLKNKSYVPSPYIVSKIYDGARHKERVIYKPRFYPDQIIHWALMLQIDKILYKRFYYYSCASIKGRGTKHGIKAIKKATKDNKNKYCLKMDVKQFYPSIDKEILKKKFRRVFKDNELLWLLDTIIDGNVSQGTGIPIGNYTSQWFANFYLTDLDNFIKEKLKARYYIRYMDDIVIFHSNKRKLRKIKVEIETFLSKEGLSIKNNWQIFNIDKRMLDFLGFRFYRNHITLRRVNFLRIKRRFKKIYKKRHLNYKDACAVISYNGMLKHSDCNHYLRKYLYPYISLKKCRKAVSNESKK